MEAVSEIILGWKIGAKIPRWKIVAETQDQ